DDRPLVDSRELQDELAGLALVAELKSKWAGFELADAVSPTYACYNGAVRVYWPGFKPGPEDQQQHFLYLPALIQKLTTKNNSLARQLFRQFATVAAFRHTDGDVITRARAAIDHERRARMDALIERSKANPSDSVDAELLQFALAENERLEKEAKQQKDRVADLERDLATAQVNFEAMSQFQQPALEGEAEEVAEADEPIGSVAAALRQV